MMIRIIITTKDDNRQFNHTARKVSKYGVFNGPYFSVFSPRIEENTDQKKLRIWTLFTQCRIFDILHFAFMFCILFEIVTNFFSSEN